VSEREEAARRVDALRAARDRIATQMYTVDTHPAWTRLESPTATGQTAALQSTLRPEVDLLWACFGALGDRLEEAGTLLAQRRLGVAPELITLLTTASVGLDRTGVPVDSTATPQRFITLDDLAGQTERRAATVLTRLSEVEASAAAVATAYVTVDGELDAVVAEATRLGETDLAERLRTAGATADLTDPVGAAPGGQLATAVAAGLDRLRADVAAARSQLAEIASARDGYAKRRDALGGLVADVAAAEQAVAEAHARVAEKIADPGLGPVPSAAPVLAARVGDLDALRQRAETDARLWKRLADDLSTVEQSASQARERAETERGLAEDLLARRDELRGRLEAYRAKAVARGRAEDDRLARLFSQAQQLLYSAPCDLRAATRAVHAYQSVLAEQPGPAERSAVDD
jgi:hypothetical protein